MSSSANNMSKDGNRRPRKKETKEKAPQEDTLEINNNTYFSAHGLPFLAVFIGGIESARLCRALGADLNEFYLKNNDNDA